MPVSAPRPWLTAWGLGSVSKEEEGGEKRNGLRGYSVAEAKRKGVVDSGPFCLGRGYRESTPSDGGDGRRESDLGEGLGWCV